MPAAITFHPSVTPGVGGVTDGANAPRGRDRCRRPEMRRGSGVGYETGVKRRPRRAATPRFASSPAIATAGAPTSPSELRSGLAVSGQNHRREPREMKFRPARYTRRCHRVRPSRLRARQFGRRTCITRLARWAEERAGSQRHQKEMLFFGLAQRHEGSHCVLEEHLLTRRSWRPRNDRRSALGRTSATGFEVCGHDVASFSAGK